VDLEQDGAACSCIHRRSRQQQASTADSGGTEAADSQAAEGASSVLTREDIGHRHSPLALLATSSHSARRGEVGGRGSGNRLRMR
jgi:hypothetical protein